MSTRFVDDLGPNGFGWTEETRYARTGHALADGARVWLVDPFEAEGVDGRIAALGEPAGVVQLLDRHNRDCAAFARRHAVPHLVVPELVPDSPFELLRVVRLPRWRESALWWPERRALVCADAIGTKPFFRGGRDAAGVHPLLRLVPPRALRLLDPLHLLVGHGEGIHGEEAAAALHGALDTARTGLPRWLVSVLRRRGPA